MRKALKSTFFTLALVVSPVALCAQDGGMMDGMEGMPKGDMSKAEFLQRAESHFEKMDTNHDGVVSLAERKAWHQQMRATHREMRENQTPKPPTE
jgi:hypothetical protein